MAQDRSILNNIKKLLGIGLNYTAYDTDVITFINSAFFNLTQIGVGAPEGFSITGDTEKWEDFFAERKDLEPVIIYVYFKTRLAFDPPQSGFLVEAIKSQIAEIEWRLNAQVETINKTT